MRLLVIDGNSILNRAFYGIKLLSTKDGMFTNGIYGFLNILEKIKDECSPQAVAIAFDMRAPTFRHKAFDQYKAGRKGMPRELAVQLPVLKELLQYLGYTIVSCEGFEADDILGTLAKACEEKGESCMIATGDRDSLQLVSEKTTVRLASTKFGQSTVSLYDMDKIKEDYGVSPKQLIDIKAIQGDSSDNIPGVQGIGEKGAGELIREYGSLQYIYDNIDELPLKPAMRDKLIKSKDMAFLSYFLGTINCQAPVSTDSKDYLLTPGEPEKAAGLMTKLELFKLMDKLGIKPGPSSVKKAEAKAELNLKSVQDASALLPMLEDAGEAYFAFDEERMCFAINEELWLFTPTELFLKAFAKAEGIKKFCYDAKRLYKWIYLKTGERLKGLEFDTMLAGYLLNPSASGYDVLRMAAEYGVGVMESEDGLVAQASAIAPLGKALLKAIEDNGQKELLYSIELPLALVLGDMELTGVQVDQKGIEAFGKKLKGEIDLLYSRVMEQVGYEFNLNSPKQLGEALFDKLGLAHGKKTKSGYSTNAEVLEGLRMEHPAVADILEYRTLSKLNSTYCEGLLKLVEADGRIRSSFNQAETRTGRISSTEPNLQNIPVRTELGREMRRFFTAKEGWTLVDADYSQIELRVLAHVAQDEVMIESFKEGKDIHRATAARVFGVPEDMVTAKMRSSAKAVNFGIVYGIGAFSLSKDIGVSRTEAENYIKEYLRNFSGVGDYMEKIIAKAKEQGFVEDIFGRRRYLPELSSSNFNMRSFGERVARNMPIQGAAADIIKIAMVRVSKRLIKEKLRARLILQVHDELIVECPKEETEQVQRLLTEEMEGAADMAVPMLVDAHSGETWYAAKG